MLDKKHAQSLLYSYRYLFKTCDLIDKMINNYATNFGVMYTHADTETLAEKMIDLMQRKKHVKKNLQHTLQNLKQAFKTHRNISKQTARNMKATWNLKTILFTNKQDMPTKLKNLKHWSPLENSLMMEPKLLVTINNKF